MTFPRMMLAGAALTLLAAVPAAAESYAEMFPALANDPEMAEVNELLGDLDFRLGTVDLAEANAGLDLGQDYYFLGPLDSAYVLETLWDNPPGAPVLGMVFPTDRTPLHDGWGMVLEYEAMGYVSDEDAEGYDYAALLAEMQADTRSENKWRQDNGYEAIELVGWAEPPSYDRDGRKLYWAQELRFGDSAPNTVNYEIRALGRHGVLIMNMIASMDQLADVRAAAPDLLGMVAYDEGSRYTDFDPSVDKVAAVGIGGLIAGKVAAKAGLLAVALAFLKKGFILLLLPLFWLKNVFTGRKATSA